MSVVALVSTFAMAQENDSVKHSKNIEEVIIDKTIKKLDTESSNKMGMKFI